MGADSRTPEKDKFLAWHRAEVAKGLTGFHCTLAPGEHTSEEVYAALNGMNEAHAAGRSRPLTDI